MKRKLVLAGIVLGVVILAAVLVVMSFPFYRYQSAACKQRGAAYSARVEKLKSDALERLRIGTTREAVVRFFAENGIPVTFAGGEATGTISVTGCAPAGCGSDEALLGLRVKVDDAGTVISEPVVGALYTDCL
jgi:hypothetical protein